MNQPRVLHGVGVSPGFAIGPAYVIHWRFPELPHRVIAVEAVDEEIQRLRDAVSDVRTHVIDLRRRTEERAGPEEARILDAQVLMLEDPELLSGVERLIRDNQLSAERAFEFKVLEYRAALAQSDNALMRQRRSDIFGIGVRVLHRLLGRSIEDTIHRPGGRPVVILADELTPGLTVEFEREHVAGFASAGGTRTSHAAILAHSMGIPCVMGIVGDLDHVPPEVDVIVDGTRGTVLIDPTRAEIEEAQRLEAARQALNVEFEKVEGAPAITKDGVVISLRTNLDLPEELAEAVSHGADGVGLLRTEFLVMGRTELPSEEEQTRYFRRVAKKFAGQPVIVRSYDLGGDKFPTGFRHPREVNPFLGWRAIRVCLDHPEIFKTQIRAMLRARTDGDIQLMLPLVTQVEEVEQSKALVAQCLQELKDENTAHASHLPIGVMIETPAAAFLADELAARCDFLSVGTNDLTQYILAVDRGHAGLAGRFTPLHPAVVRALFQIVEAGRHHGLKVSVCGEMASDVTSALLLLSLGFTVFSVAPPSLPLVRWFVRQVDVGALSQLRTDVTQASTSQEVKGLLDNALSAVGDVKRLLGGRLPQIPLPGSF